MDTQNPNTAYNGRPNKNRVWGGMFLLFLGFIFFIKEADFFFFPGWLFSWPMILIAVGLYTGIKHNFKGGGWIIPVIIGGIFLIDRFDIGLDLHRFIFPAIIIGIGLMMIMRPKRPGPYGYWAGQRYRRDRNYLPEDQKYLPEDPAFSGSAGEPGYTPGPEPISSNDYFDLTSVLGSTHRVVTSKNFKGGDITCFLGGAEIDLSNADINGTVVIDVTTVLGGAKLIIPTNWEVKPEITNVLGGVEDKRQVQGKIIDFNKVLVIKGTSFMGGIELRSY